MKRVSRWMLGAFYIFAGVMHFARPEIFMRIVPPYLPFPLALVLLSGVAEIALGIGIFLRRTRRWAAFGIIGLLIAVFPANLYMYQAAIAQGGAFDGHSADVLYARLWLQAVLIAWAVWHAGDENLNPYPV